MAHLMASLLAVFILGAPPPRPDGQSALKLAEIEEFILAKLAYDQDYFGEILRLERQGRVHPRLTRAEFESEVKRARANFPVLERFAAERRAPPVAGRHSLPASADVHREYTNLIGMLNLMAAWRAGDAPAVLATGSRLVVRRKEDFGHVRGDASRFYVAMYRLYFFLMAAAHYATGQDAQSVEWMARLEGDQTLRTLKQRLATPLADPEASRDLRLEMLRARPVAVMPFDVRGGDATLAWAPAALQQVMTTDLVRGSDLALVERGQLDKIMDEAALGAAGFTDDSRVRDLGKLLGAGTLLVGSLQRQGDAVLLAARLVDGEDGQVLGSAQAAVPEAELFAGGRRVLAELFASVRWDAALSVESLQSVAPPRVDTVKGLHQARLNLAADRAGAREAFARAARSDPAVANLFQDLAREFSDVTARVAVVDVQNLSGSAAEDWMARGVLEALNTDLPRIGFAVVERARIDEVVNARAAGPVDAAAARDVGRLVSADFVVMGSVLHQRPVVRVDVRFVDVRTGVVSHAASSENARDDFMGALAGLVSNLADHFNRSLDEAALTQLVGARQSPQQYEAFIRAELARASLQVSARAAPATAAATAPARPRPPPPVPWRDRARPVLWGTAAAAVATGLLGVLSGTAMVLLGAVVASQADARANQLHGMQLIAAESSRADLRASRDAAALQANLFKAVAWTGGAVGAAAMLVLLGGGGVLAAERAL